MYKYEITSRLYNYHTVFYCIDNNFNFSVSESWAIKSYLIEEISHIISDVWLPYDVHNQKYVEVYNYVKDFFFCSLDIIPMPYQERKIKYDCLYVSVTPSEIGSAWIRMLKTNYNVTLEILNALNRLYTIDYKSLRHLFIEQMYEDGILDDAYKGFIYDNSKYSRGRFYRMKLLLEKYDQLHKIINFTKI